MTSKFSPILFRVVTDNEPKEDFTELGPLEAQILIKRATQNFNELIDVLNENVSDAADATPADRTPDTNVDDETKGDTAHDANTQNSRSNMSIEIEWNVDSSVVSEKVQENIIMLVGAGILFSLKDLLEDIKK